MLCDWLIILGGFAFVGFLLRVELVVMSASLVVLLLGCLGVCMGVFMFDICVIDVCVCFTLFCCLLV